MCIDLNRHEDRRMLKEIISEVTNPLLTDINIKLNKINVEVDYIKEQTTETNGKVKKHELLLSEIKKDDEIHLINHQHEQNNRLSTCPHSNTILELKEKQTFKIKAKQLVLGFLGTVLLVLSITLTTVKINDTFKSDAEIQQTEKMERILKILENNDIVID